MGRDQHTQILPGGIDEDRVRLVRELYERGRTIDALRKAEEIEPLGKWLGVEPCVLAARIAANTGSSRLASRLTVRAWRTDKTHPEAQAQYAYELWTRRGAFFLWRTMRRWPDAGVATAEQAAELLAIKGRIAADLRDFSRAEEFLKRAEALDPGRAWIRVQYAGFLEIQDRVEEALDMVRAATALYPYPFYRVGTQMAAHLLQLLDRDEEATQLLGDASVVLQNGPVAAQCYSLLSENGRWKDAEQELERFVELSPLLDARGRKWVTSQRARVAYHLGRRSEAAALARLLEDDFHQRFAARLQDDSPIPERIQLEVTFVRQHFKTCAPATLAALGRFWRMPAEHLKLAETVCYDGTPSWQQREWAEKNGWFVREFRVNWEGSITLIGLGIPFALATVEATSAHMMAVIGFDRLRGTLLLRDPAQPYVIEANAEEFLNRYRAFGPHGMAFVPERGRDRLIGVDLPDSELYDRYHRVCLALAAHRRGEAAVALTQMESRNDDALTWQARLELAAYDANIAEQTRCLDRLLELFPNNPARLLKRLECLQSAPRDERIKFLKTACKTENADPALFIALGRELHGDARCLEEARSALRRGMRFRPMDSSAISTLADQIWEEGNFEEATDCYRFSANLEGFHEDRYQAWFVACRRTRRTEEAMGHIQDRFSRFGSRSGQPAVTLAWAWHEMDQPAKARQVLVEAERLRPDDGYLRLRSAVLSARLGDAGETERRLDSAQGAVRENDWLRAAAEVAEIRFDAQTAAGRAREVLELEPLALDAHAGLARAMAQLDGTAAALTHLRQAAARFPHHCGLMRMVVDWSRQAGPEAHEAAARELLDFEPGDAWARRELALVLIRRHQSEDALREAEEASRIEPGNSYSFSVLGAILRHLNRIPEARDQFQRAVALSVDNDDAISGLLEMARSDSERRDHLVFIERELVRQVVTGDGLLAYLEIARPILEPEALLRVLRQAHTERPDLWHAWSALVSQLGHQQLLDEALTLAKQAVERFPHMPRIWLDLASVHRWRNELDAEIVNAERAVEINPGWNHATLVLAGGLERRDQLDDARRVYERALRHSPKDAHVNTLYAWLLWRLRKETDAFDAVERALRLAPGYDSAWEFLSEWSVKSGLPDRPVAFARALTEERPGETSVWLMLARVLPHPGAAAERLAAVERAIGLEPRLTDAWDLKAELLAVEERFDDAIQACVDGAGICAADTHVLRGRQAWIEARRRRIPEAVTLMNAVLAENRNFLWGWHQLAIWLLEAGEILEATAALEQMRQLRPHDAWVNRQLGFLRLKQGDRPAARTAFAAALKAAPTDIIAAHKLLELDLEASTLEAAAATLQVMKLHQPGAPTLSAEFTLQLRNSDAKAALRTLELLCKSPDPDPWPVDAAIAAIERAGRTARALRIFKRAIKSGECNPQLGVAVIRILLSKGSTLAATWHFSRLESGELQRRAAALLISGLAKKKSDLLIRWLLRYRRDVLFRDDEAWGQVGFALSNFNRMKQVARWLSDWRQRADVQPWMLFNYCLALRHLGRYDEATEVARHVVQTWGHRERSADLRLFLAVEEALAGAISVAQEHLKHVVVREDTPYDLQTLALAKAVVEFQLTPGSERRKRFNQVRDQLRLRFDGWQIAISGRDVRRTFARAGRLFYREGGGPKAWLWFKWKLHWQWLMIPPIAVVLLTAPRPGLLLVGLLIWRLAARSNR